MRRWEFVGDGSAKFWEAAVEGSSVVVRYGRIGTAGREQVKELASAGAAEAHLAKLIGEKTRKGYTEADGTPVSVGPVAAPAEPAAPDGTEEPEAAGLPDESTFVFPATWQRVLHPRRGGRVRAVPRPAPKAVGQAEERIAAQLDWIEQVLASRNAPKALVAAARAYLAGEADPLGAAMLAEILPPAWHHNGVEKSPFADAWAVRFGLPFAARAVLELSGIQVLYHQSGMVRVDPQVRYRSPDRPGLNSADQLAGRLRALLAVADEAVYQETLDALEELRTTPARRLLAAYLAPGTPGWTEECLAEMDRYGRHEGSLRALLLATVDHPAQLDGFGPDPRLGYHDWTVGLFATLADGVGTEADRYLDAALGQYHSTDELRTVASVAVQLPTDRAFRFLLGRLTEKQARPALQEAMQRYPVRAARLLAETVLADGPTAPDARRLLATHVQLQHAVLPELLAELDAPAVELIASLDGVRPRVAEAAPEELPALLVSPPWTRPRARRTVRVLTGLQADAAPEVEWRAGEQERWSAGEDGWPFPPRTDWKKEAKQVFGPNGNFWYARRLLMQGPRELLAPMLEKWRPVQTWGGGEELRPVVVRYGLTALPALLAAASSQPASIAPLLLPFRDAGVARVMADCLVRLKSAQPTARSWFARHGVAGALLLVPEAVGPDGAARKAAEQALRLVAAEAGAQTLGAAVAGRYGVEAAGIVGEALSADPLENALPAKLPALPVWVQPAVLPQLLLASGAALPEQAVRHVLTMLALSRPEEPFPGLAVVTGACRPDSLAAFGWALFEEWRQAGTPPKESWALTALGVLGDDETVRRLTPVLREWPGEGAHHRAVEGLGVLAAIGSDVALLHLHGIAQRVKFKALKSRAQERIAEVAEGLGLTADQLSDRLVPDLGLDPDGTTVVDYGPRRFTVGFDEQLRPYVLDGDGRRRKDLPVPGVKDDPELAPAERKRFAALKKDVRTVASDQLRRLEAAMVAQRAWTAAEFRELFVRHPLVWHLARRLVWLADTEGGPRSTVTTAFRVAEDRTFADAADQEFALPEDATVRLAHPLLLDGAALAAWSELFADYELLQPFPQLGRSVRHLTADELAANRLHRFEGSKVPVGRLLGLTKRGAPQDAGVERWFSRRLGERCHLVIQLHEGIAVGAVEMFPDQTFETVWLDTVPRDHWDRGDLRLRFRDVDPIAASELLVDLEEVTSA
ncbi:DUF4132 domain-containing protein [Kitasatospora sp. NPDC051853]|uniref:DUF4132 domain-containing protein n=1 Tax=Kitasatospora sp. NPDC051853 TaxID=3364058 RepID=UPI0037BA4EAA